MAGGRRAGVKRERMGLLLLTPKTSQLPTDARLGASHNTTSPRYTNISPETTVTPTPANFTTDDCSTRKSLCVGTVFIERSLRNFH